MPVTIKSSHEIELMRVSCGNLAVLHEELAKLIRPGISTLDIDREAARIIKSFGCVSSFLNYNGYPGHLCVSVNEEVVHGIPKAERILKEGDIVSLDAGMIYEGYHSDAARTWAVGQTEKANLDLIAAAEECFFRGIEKARAGHHLHEISEAINACADAHGYGVVRELCGHGIGRELHEPPQIPNHRQNTKGILLRPGMTLAIEPMITMGSREVRMRPDKWTVVTRDGRPAAHYENTVLITEGEPEILTVRQVR